MNKSPKEIMQDNLKKAAKRHAEKMSREEGVKHVAVLEDGRWVIRPE